MSCFNEGVSKMKRDVLSNDWGQHYARQVLWRVVFYRPINGKRFRQTKFFLTSEEACAFSASLRADGHEVVSFKRYERLQ